MRCITRAFLFTSISPPFVHLTFYNYDSDSFHKALSITDYCTKTDIYSILLAKVHYGIMTEENKRTMKRKKKLSPNLRTRR